ncbi:MAG: phosphodiesterase [Firmicutes bacterium]|nr:phosphodiesterase [Bacillota bacterium]MDY6160306.1 phosphodiesterase [Candidatus Faecousia sp.]
MKLLIASDIHGSAYWCGKLMDLIQAENPDRVILLGDLLYHGPRNDLPKDYAPKQVIPMLSGIQEKIVAVRGNCEAEVDQMVLPFPCLADYAQLLVDGKLFHLSHGHHQNPEQLPPLPQGSVFLFGHTHVKLDQQVNGIRCLNPGSVSIPKDGSHSCLIYENGKFSFKILED